MLQLDRLCVRIAGAEVLRNVSLHVRPNSFAALVGRNGAGKTTLMRTVMNLIPRWAGEIRIGDRATTEASPSDHARYGVGYMPEDRRLIAGWTVEQNILLPTLATRIPDAGARLEQCYSVIPELVPFARRRAMELSGGQQKLVALARALMVGRNLLLLDEPFEGVAPALAQRIAEILSELRTSGSLTVLISESDAVHTRSLVDLTYSIERGKIRQSTTGVAGEAH
ncbi:MULTISPECIES: ATP-binding cassette domain-containing protein [unclassified Bradyrhizobium]|uniref:ABC transporter ATP-binding protein n=1 Tax=unclassified Bradyrhizobium TaxID=2631580 RepID=UPI00102E8B82|nr:MULTISPECIES: ATP-binding cassette domain-containing protein [unclassified Bradyrhizobium]MDI4237138.1 ATP-binding cassette domain-containing protein [Bradyrhizobium sp. Arg237L]TAI65585.1 ABC transporter ATP-binding protein [Bradyrhizobium sp. Leo170]